ncbi:MAG: hypothetical protein C0404_14010, partial [Verrucomicrobia bacterium]|nr:hypothetical protein [Verrucomicrobiota bacterium]
KWSNDGATDGRVSCDPVREQVMYKNTFVFDLKTGKMLSRPTMPNVTDDVAYDKRGYLHVHLNPGFSIPAVVRLNPSAQIANVHESKNGSSFREVPYDYGEGKIGPYNAVWLGALPVRDQPGAKFFQDGIGVNMRGDVAENCNIYYVPKMEELGVAMARAGIDAQLKLGQYVDGNQASRFERHIAELKKRGEEIYSIPRQPGYALCGGTIWTFNASGELRKELAVNAGGSAGGAGMVNGPAIDDEYAVYFVNNRPRVIPNSNSAFLAGHGGVFGVPNDQSKSEPYTMDPFTGTLIKTKPDTFCNFVSENAPIPLEDPPKRTKDVAGGWFEGAEWLYAGASPIVPGGCSCPTQRLHLDWYKRTYVPEAYRHSIGVLDTAGNLILHVGRYGNWDSWSGPNSKIPVGGDGIGIYIARFISGTDNYLVFDDKGERLVVLKLNYHAEETVEIK